MSDKLSIERYIDYSALKPEMPLDEVRRALERGVEDNYRAICARPCEIDLAVSLCKGTDTSPCCVMDYPHGTGGKEAKAQLARIYAEKGAVELDTVINISYVRSGLWDMVADEISATSRAAHDNGAILKVIFEIGYLNLEEIARATEVCIESGADFVKTCTGFYKPITDESVETMVKTAAGRIKVKASGPGISDLATATKYVEMGVERLGIGFGFADAILAEARGEAAANPTGLPDKAEY